MGRYGEAHRAVKEIIVLNDSREIAQKYHIDDMGHLVPSAVPKMHPFGNPAPGRPHVERLFAEAHAPPVPMIHRAYAPIRTLQAPDDADPFYAPRFYKITVYDSRSGAESDFEPWFPGE
jgi:ribosomal protein S16